MLLMFFLLALSIATVIAEDVPFVFSKDYASIAGYSLDQIRDISMSNEDLIGIPFEAFEEYNPNLVSRVEPRNAIVRHESVLLAQKYPGNHTIGQICSIFSYLQTGDNTSKGWSYINDPRGSNYYEYANESLQLGREVGYSGTGDCDDFAIVMSALIEAVGGTTRIVFAKHDNGDSGHAFAEVYLGQDDNQNSMIGRIVSWLMDHYATSKIYAHVNPDTREVWLNLDWSANHPGGRFYKSDKYEFYYIRPELEKTSINADASGKLREKRSDKTAYELFLRLRRLTDPEELDEALDVFDKALAATPTDIEADDIASTMYYILIRQGMYEEALRACEKVIEKNPRAPCVWYLKSEALKALGLNSEARAAYAHGEKLGYDPGCFV